jgi:7-carboxy-7-deazaguanine synthase
MQQYLVNEIFYTIQGEARFTGHPSVFVRLQGCGVGCPWCDTKHTWDRHARDIVSIDAMLAKTGDGASYAAMTAQEIIDSAIKMAGRKPALLTITGGEPAEQPLNELTTLIAKNGIHPQLETSGTEELDVSPDTWVTLSPKIDMPNRKPIQRQAVFRANEIKMPVGKQRDVEILKAFLQEFRDVIGPRQNIWLQPLSQNPKATQLCVDTAMANGWHLSMQTHKYIGVR